MIYKLFFNFAFSLRSDIYQEILPIVSDQLSESVHPFNFSVQLGLNLNF